MEMTISSSKIAENIKKFRLSRNMTQVELADKLGYSERQIRRLESSGTYNLQIIDVVSKALNISALDILGYRMS